MYIRKYRKSSIRAVFLLGFYAGIHQKSHPDPEGLYKSIRLMGLSVSKTACFFFNFSVITESKKTVRLKIPILLISYELSVLMSGNTGCYE